MQNYTKQNKKLSETQKFDMPAQHHIKYDFFTNQISYIYLGWV